MSHISIEKLFSSIMVFTAIYKDKYFCRKLFGLMFPISMQSLMLSLVAAGDAFMLARLDQDSMAAVSLATQIQFIQNMILCAITGGLSILGAQYWGKGDKETLHNLFCISIKLSVVVSFLFFIGCYFYPQYLMHLFAHDPTLVHLGAGYLKIASWSYLLTGISQCYLAIMKVSEHASRSAWISSWTVVLNIVFNAFLIFGLCNLPAMGAKGAAIATVLARIIELAWCVLSSFKKGFIRLQVRNILTYFHDLEHDFLHACGPIFGAYMLWSVGFTSYTAIMGHLGSDAAAANSIAAVVRDIMCCLCNGLAGGGSILVGNELGAGKLDLGKKYGTWLMWIAIATGLLSMVIVALSVPALHNFVKLSETASNYMTGMLLITAFYMNGRVINTIVENGVFTAGGDTMFDFYTLIIFLWCLALPCAMLGAFVFHWPVLVVYACTCLDEVGKLPWVFRHFYKYKWVRNLTR